MDLARTQFLSLVTKGVTMALGIVQTFVVLKLLSKEDFGLIGLVTAVALVVGVAQHLGLQDGVIKEVATRKRDEIGKVVWVAVLLRLLITVPLSLGLVLLARFIGEGFYGEAVAVLPLQVFAGILVLQGLQDVFGAALTGLKKFTSLYLVQAVTATLNVFVFGLFVWWWDIIGFFAAMAVMAGVMVSWFYWLLSRDSQLRVASVWQIRAEHFKEYSRSLFRVSWPMYIARIAFVVWQRLPLLVLGGVLAADARGDINAALAFGGRLTIIAMALSEVNLSWMSSLYERSRDEFEKVVTRNMQRILLFLGLIASLLIFFAKDLLMLVGLDDYLVAYPLIVVMTLAFFLYALIDVGTSAVFAPANKPGLRAWTFVLMTGVTAGMLAWIATFQPTGLAAALAVLIGAIASYIVMVLLALRFGVMLVTRQLGIVLGLMGLSGWWLLSEPGFLLRAVIFIGLAIYILYEGRRSNLVPNLRQSFGWRAGEDSPIRIICFAGAEYDALTWTNRQHIMSRLSKDVPVLYVEPRVWVFRYIWRNRRDPRKLTRYLARLAWFEQRSERLFIKSQFNLLPYSRESKAISRLNHWLNRWCVKKTAWWLGFQSPTLWLYDTEAAEYLSAWPHAKVVYDCVDDHAAQAGVDRNPDRVRLEEDAIFTRADLVTVTSKRLYSLKKDKAENVRLVLNAGDVELFAAANLETNFYSYQVTIGSVGALDSYKYDFEMLRAVMLQHPNWKLVLIGKPVVDAESGELVKLLALPNVEQTHVAREKVPALVSAFDILTIPYRESEYNASSFPLKFWEFMATGKPIIVSGLPELQEYRNLIEYVTSAEEFAAAVKKVFEYDDRGSQRITLAQDYSWEKRVARLKELLFAMHDINTV